ncbi:septum formation family protein [Nakamurella sp. GG22]
MRWKPTISFRAVQLVPGEEEQRAGRNWTACLVLPSDEPTYQGTLRDAVTAGMPAGFGLCWNGTDLGRMPENVPCSQPHLAEVVATGWVRDRSTVTIPEVADACAGIAGRLMGSADPTRGGRLRVVADRMTSQTDGRSDGPLTVACFVTAAAGQQLSGSVVGLGERDVPFVQ